MNCSICTHPLQLRITVDYLYSRSYRRTAQRFGVGYRSLHRHINECVAAMFAEYEERKYTAEFNRVSGLVREYFIFLRDYKPRKRSIVTKPVEFTWSRRSWKQRKIAKKVRKKE